MRRLELILAHRAGGKLLEIGTGGGDFLELAATRFDVSAIDVSPYAKFRLPAALRDRVTVGDIETTDIPSRMFEVITAFNVLEHLERPGNVIRKAAEALAPGGIFVGSMPCNAGWIGSAYTAMTNFFDRTHRSCYTVPAWRKTFLEAGLPDTQFFGEIVLTGAVCIYVFAPLWPHISLNLMFLSRRGAA